MTTPDKFSSAMSEPWFDVPPTDRLKTLSRDDRIARNQQRRQSAKWNFYQNAFDFICDNNIRGDYFEFGCHRGRTFRMALIEAAYQALTDMKFRAFDSFEGLPQNDSGSDVGQRWNAGNLCTSVPEFLSLVHPYCDTSDQIRIYQGFYDRSLSPALVSSLKSEGAKIAFLCVDCDFFESAAPVFDFCDNFLQDGAVVYIDDYFAGYRGVPDKGVQAAFRAFQRSSNWKFQEYLPVGAFGKSFLAYSDRRVSI